MRWAIILNFKGPRREAFERETVFVLSENDYLYNEWFKGTLTLQKKLLTKQRNLTCSTNSHFKEVSSLSLTCQK